MFFCAFLWLKLVHHFDFSIQLSFHEWKLDLSAQGDMHGENPMVIPSEKTEKNPTPLKFFFFAWNLITGLINDDLGHFWPPGPPWGALGAPEGFWGV